MFYMVFAQEFFLLFLDSAFKSSNLISALIPHFSRISFLLAFNKVIDHHSLEIINLNCEHFLIRFLSTFAFAIFLFITQTLFNFFLGKLTDKLLFLTVLVYSVSPLRVLIPKLVTRVLRHPFQLALLGNCSLTLRL